MADAERIHAMLFAPSETGHMMPLLDIAEAVAKAGHVVTVCTSDFEEAKWRPKAESMGAKFWPIDCGGVTAEALREREKVKEKEGAPFAGLLEIWRGPVKRMISEAEVRPDVIVADFCALAAQRAAEELRVPLVINLPGTLAQLGGMTKAAPQMGVFGRIFGRQVMRSVVLVNSFFGLEPPRPLPPNIKMIGPVSPPVSQQRRCLADEEPELSKWLRKDERPVVLVSTGSLVMLTDWQVEIIFNAVKLANIRAVWSLREEQQEALPARDDPDFWISPWLPQAALLQEEAIKLVITHCGWGGTLELLAGAKPSICMPFFGDQFVNADLLMKSGCAVPFCKPLPTYVLARGNPYSLGMFSAESVAAVMWRVLEDNSCAECAKKQQRAARATGGAAEAARQVEWAARWGVQHLCSEDASRQGCAVM